MPKTNESWAFPFNHLAVLGMDKLKKYVPPTKATNDDVSGPAKKSG